MDSGPAAAGTGKCVPGLHNPALPACPFLTAPNKALPRVLSSLQICWGLWEEVPHHLLLSSSRLIHELGCGGAELSLPVAAPDTTSQGDQSPCGSADPALLLTQRSEAGPGARCGREPRWADEPALAVFTDSSGADSTHVLCNLDGRSWAGLCCGTPGPVPVLRPVLCQELLAPITNLAQFCESWEMEWPETPSLGDVEPPLPGLSLEPWGQGSTGTLFHLGCLMGGWPLAPPSSPPQGFEGFIGHILAMAGGRTKL